MLSKPIIAGICGSTRNNSSNHAILRQIAQIFADQFELRLIEGIDQLPHFNPDLDKETDSAPGKIAAFRKELRAADGILICTPEYAMGVPGTLKNAIDWTVSSMEFSKKPVALITASSLGQKGHASLTETLLIIESDMPESSRLLIPHIKTRMNHETITDEATLIQISQLVSSLLECVADRKS